MISEGLEENIVTLFVFLTVCWLIWPIYPEWEDHNFGAAHKLLFQFYKRDFMSLSLNFVSNFCDRDTNYVHIALSIGRSGEIFENFYKLSK